MDSEVVELIEKQANIISRLGQQRGSLRTPPPGVSIVISNRNQGYFLPRSVHSALLAMQNLQKNQVRAEVLVIDDDSCDSSLTLLRQLEALYFRRGLKVLALGQNVGLPVVRSIALEISGCRHIVFLDPDHELVPQNLPLFHRAAEETRAAVVYGSLTCTTQGDEESGAASNDQRIQPSVFATRDIDACALFDRAQVFDAGGYIDHPQPDRREASDLLLRLAVSGRRIVFVRATFAVYDGLSASALDEKHEPQVDNEAEIFLRRMLDQRGLRHAQVSNLNYMRYHPEIGYL